MRHAPRDASVRRLLAAADALAILAALAGVLLLTGAEGAGEHLIWGAFTLPAWVLIFKAYDLYDRDVKRISHTTVDDLPWIFHSMLVGCLLLWVYFRLAPTPKIEFANLLLFGVLAVVLLVFLRSFSRRAATHAFGRERVLLVGDAERLLPLARKMAAHPEYGVDPVGFLSSSPDSREDAPLPVLGHYLVEDLADVIHQHAIERIVVSHEDFAEGALVELIRCSRPLGVKVSVLPQLFDAIGPSLAVDDVEGVTILGLNPPVLSRSSRALKRAMDLAGAGLLFLVASPLIVLIALAIRIDSRGPVFFVQERIGRGGRRFRLVKFRTMVSDAEELRAELEAESEDPNWLLVESDPRITRVGRFLRRSSLDELPQLWNVLRGEMSLVGPRPLIAAEDSQLKGWRRSRVDLTPGLTGLWQVLGRTSIPFEEMIKLDYIYVTNWSLWNDVRLMLRTLPAVLLQRGAN